MNEKSKALTLTTLSDRVIVLTSIIEAPRELVFKTLTDPKLIPQWWGPKAYSTTVDKMDVKPGGVWRYVQRGPDGKEHAFNGEYREIVPPERYVYTFNYEATPGHESLETVTLEELEDGRTKMTDRVVLQSIEDSDEMLNSGMEKGATESIERFSELLKQIQKGQVMAESSTKPGATSGEITITRVFDAPRELVWKMWTDPEHVKCWFGPKGYTTPYSKIDLRVGGTNLSCMRSPEGKDYWGIGTYREIVEPERIVNTDSFADEKGNIVPASYYGMSADWPLELLITVTFEEQNGKTRLTLRHTGFPPGPDTEMAEAGWIESFDKLEECLAK